MTKEHHYLKLKLDGKVETNRGNVLWSHSSMTKILNNPHHKGHYTHLGVKVPCPPIVEVDLWERVNKVLSDKTSRQVSLREQGKGKGNKSYEYKLSK